MWLSLYAEYASLLLFISKEVNESAALNDREQAFAAGRSSVFY